MAWNGQGDPPTELRLLYLPPHAVLQDPQTLLSRYQTLRRMAGQGILQRAETHCHDDAASLSELTTPRPLLALVTVTLLREQPTLLDAFLDLELLADLGGMEPDSDYLNRLRQLSRLAPLLQELDNNAIRQRASQLQQSFHQQQLQRLEQELNESRHDLNHRLEQLRELDQDQRRLHQAAEASAQREATLQQQVHDLQDQRSGLEEANGRLQERLDQLEARLLQLRQSEAETLGRCQVLEDELEQRDRERHQLETIQQDSAALAEAQQQQIHRASQLLQKLSLRHRLVSASGQQSIQVLALLEGYRHSLKRAERLLLGRVGAGLPAGGRG